MTQEGISYKIKQEMTQLEAQSMTETLWLSYKSRVSRYIIVNQ